MYCYFTFRYDGVTHSSPAVSLDTSSEDKPSTPTDKLSNENKETPAAQNDNDGVKSESSPVDVADLQDSPVLPDKSGPPCPVPSSANIKKSENDENIIVPHRSNISSHPNVEATSQNLSPGDQASPSEVHVTTSGKTQGGRPDEEIPSKGPFTSQKATLPEVTFTDRTPFQDETLVKDNDLATNKSSDAENSWDRANQNSKPDIESSLGSRSVLGEACKSVLPVSTEEVEPHQTFDNLEQAVTTSVTPEKEETLISKNDRNQISSVPEHVVETDSNNNPDPNLTPSLTAPTSTNSMESDSGVNLESPIVVDLTKEVNDLSDMIRNREWVVDAPHLEVVEKETAKHAESSYPVNQSQVVGDTQIGKRMDMEKNNILDDSLDMDTDAEINLTDNPLETAQAAPPSSRNYNILDYSLEIDIPYKAAPQLYPPQVILPVESPSMNPKNNIGSPDKNLKVELPIPSSASKSLVVHQQTPATSGLSDDSLDEEISTVRVKSDLVGNLEEPVSASVTLGIVKGTLSVDSLDEEHTSITKKSVPDSSQVSHEIPLPTVSSIKNVLSNDSLDEPAALISTSISQDNSSEQASTFNSHGQVTQSSYNHHIGITVADESMIKEAGQSDGKNVDVAETHKPTLSAVESILSSGSTDEPMDTLDESLDLSKYGNDEEDDYSDDFLSDDDPYAPSASSSSSTIFSTDTLEDRMDVLKEEEEPGSEASLMNPDDIFQKFPQTMETLDTYPCNDGNEIREELLANDVGEEAEKSSIGPIESLVDISGKGPDSSVKPYMPLVQNTSAAPYSAQFLVHAFQLQEEYDGPLLEVLTKKLDENIMHTEYDSPICGKKGTGITEVLPEALLIPVDDGFAVEPKNESDTKLSAPQVLQKDFEEVRELLDTANVALEDAIRESHARAVEDQASLDMELQNALDAGNGQSHLHAEQNETTQLSSLASDTQSKVQQVPAVDSLQSGNLIAPNALLADSVNAVPNLTVDMPEEKHRSVQFVVEPSVPTQQESTSSVSDSLDGVISASFSSSATNNHASTYQFANSQLTSSSLSAQALTAESVASEIVQSVLMDTLSYLYTRSALSNALLTIDSADSMDDARSTPSSEKRYARFTV